MNNILNLVKGCISKKTLDPILNHFHLYKGRIQGSNGKIAIDAPYSDFMQLDCTVPAKQFLNAIESCSEFMSVKQSKNRLIIKDKSFRASLPLADHEAFPKSKRFGKVINIYGNLLEAFRLLQPFVGSDTSRLWSCGILFKEGRLYATNSIVLATTKSPWPSFKETINVPGHTINELLRINIHPISIQLSDTAIVFNYANGAWVKSPLSSCEWPDISALLEIKTQTKIPKKLYDAVKQIKPFCKESERLRFNENGLHVESEKGIVDITGFKMPECSFRYEPLQAVLDIATHMDFTYYPKPCPWKGENIKGVIVGGVL